MDSGSFVHVFDFNSLKVTGIPVTLISLDFLIYVGDRLYSSRSDGILLWEKNLLNHLYQSGRHSDVWVPTFFFRLSSLSMFVYIISVQSPLCGPRRRAFFLFPFVAPDFLIYAKKFYSWLNTKGM